MKLNLSRRKKQSIEEPPRLALEAPEFTWCSEAGHTYSWMNRELVELVVHGALAIPVCDWHEDTLNEKSGYSALTTKGARVFLRTHSWTGHGRNAKNEYYIYVDDELIGRFTEVRGDFVDYHYGYTGVEYVCRHVVYEIYEIELERNKPEREAEVVKKQREKTDKQNRARQQVEAMKRKF